MTGMIGDLPLPSFALAVALLASAGTKELLDFGVFALGLVAGVIIVVSIRRDFRRAWHGEERRRRAK